MITEKSKIHIVDMSATWQRGHLIRAASIIFAAISCSSFLLAVTLRSKLFYSTETKEIMLLLSLLPNIHGTIRKQRHRFLQLGAGKRYGKGLGWSFQNVEDEKHMAHPLFLEKATTNWRLKITWPSLLVTFIWFTFLKIQWNQIICMKNHISGIK